MLKRNIISIVTKLVIDVSHGAIDLLKFCMGLDLGFFCFDKKKYMLVHDHISKHTKSQLIMIHYKNVKNFFETIKMGKDNVSRV